MYVNNVAAASIDDYLFRPNRSPLNIAGSEGTRQQTRVELHFKVELGIVRFFGHLDLEGKSWFPGFCMDFLSVTIRTGEFNDFCLTAKTSDAYGLEVRRALQSS